MAEQRIPQGGLRKPRSASTASQPFISPGLMTFPNHERLLLGRIRVAFYMHNRYCGTTQVGPAGIYVTNDFGILVLVEKEEVTPWC